MICVDTTFLVDLWREKDLALSPAKRILVDHAGEDFAVPAHAAGEFLEGGAAVSEERLAQSLHFLRLFRVGDVGIETARRYALIVAGMRAASTLAGKSRPDLWIAAWALEHNAPLVTSNVRHFADVPDLRLLGYST